MTENHLTEHLNIFQGSRGFICRKETKVCNFLMLHKYRTYVQLLIYITMQYIHKHVYTIAKKGSVVRFFQNYVWVNVNSGRKMVMIKSLHSKLNTVRQLLTAFEHQLCKHTFHISTSSVKTGLGALAQQPLIVLIPTFLLGRSSWSGRMVKKCHGHCLSRSLLPLIQKKAFFFLLSSSLFWFYHLELYFCGSLSPHLVPGSSSSSSRQLFLRENTPTNWVRSPCLARKSRQTQLATSWRSTEAAKEPGTLLWNWWRPKRS